MNRIEEIKARVEAATPGPWWGDHANYCVVQAHRAHDDNPETVADNVYAEDIDFIAHAREDIPYLLDELADSFPKTWSGLMAFVDHYYPRDIFTESDDQPGSRIVWMARQLARVTAERDEALKSLPMPLGATAIAEGRAEAEFLRDKLADMTKERDEWKVGVRDSLDLHSKALATADKLRDELTRLRAVVEEARRRTFNLYRDGTLREDLGQNGEPLSEIHNLLASALDRVKGDEE